MTPCSARWTSCGGFFDLAGKESALAELDALISAPTFWDDAPRAQEVNRRRRDIGAQVESARRLARASEDAEVLRQLVQEGEEATADYAAALDTLETVTSELELATLLTGEQDASPAILTVHAGAGGTESMDWAAMLLRMYLRWCERRGWRARVIDEQPGEEAGIKSATVEVDGVNAFGFLKPEVGVHRLVRISPFDAAARRHTSFASVSVVPVVADDIDIVIEDKDLRIDTYRSSGAGGQHVNVTDSAVRITHLPSGIVVSCQNERSQHKNRAVAFKVLRSRLAERERQKREEKRLAAEAEKKDIAFGSQIRSYVLQPYRLIKDHRTGLEIGNVDRVLDGDLDELVKAELGARRARGA